MPANCGMIAGALEKMAPRDWAESWDNVGLLIGSPAQEVEKVLLSLDVTTAVVDEAWRTSAGLIISHHPFPFHSLKSIRLDTPEGELLAKLLQRNISVYAAHTNLDVALGGVNDALAEKLSLRNAAILRRRREALVKISTYVPAEYEETVWRAMSDAGAGCIGKYSECSFRTTGVGTFFPTGDAKPFIGRKNQLSRVGETRVESIAPARLARQIVAAIVAAHPYEEPAYDIYPLNNDWSTDGLGRIGDLATPVTLSDFVQIIRTALSVDGLRVVGDPKSIVRRVAVCGGAGMEVAKDAVQQGAQVLVTGDIRYHDAQEALSMGLNLVDAGHFATEQPVLESLRRYLQDFSNNANWDCIFEISQSQVDVWRWI